MKTSKIIHIAILLTAMALLSSKASADSAISTWYHQKITVWLADFDKDGYESNLREVGSGERVVVPSSVIANFRDDMPRGQYPAVGLLIRCTPTVKLKNGDETDGTYKCQIEDGIVASYSLNPDNGGISMDFRFGIYP